MAARERDFAAVADELNELLVSIRSRSAAVRERLSDDAALATELAELSRSADAAAALVALLVTNGDEPINSPDTRPERHGGETILLVEDEDSVRSVTIKMLAGGGYDVIEARDGGEALAAARETRRPIHLLLTDLVMPKMDGIELARRLTRAHSGLSVLYMSGYASESILGSGEMGPGMMLLEKPFTSMQLLDRVREALDAPATASRGFPTARA
jgi:CheY-like chemotaxis protein